MKPKTKTLFFYEASEAIKVLEHPEISEFRHLVPKAFDFFLGRSSNSARSANCHS